MTKTTKKRTSISINNLKLKEIFVFNWASGVMVFVLLCAVAWFYVQNKDLKKSKENQAKTITELKSTQLTLQNQVAKLEGANQAYNSTIQTFMENPPGPMNLRIKNVENWLGKKFGYGGIFVTTPDSNFVNRVPGMN